MFRFRGLWEGGILRKYAHLTAADGRKLANSTVAITSSDTIHSDISPPEHVPFLEETTEMAAAPETDFMPYQKSNFHFKEACFLHSELFRNYSERQGYSRSFVLQRVRNTKNANELVEFLSVMFRRAMVIDSTTGTCEELLLDKNLLLLVLHQCEQVMDLRLPWMILSQIRLLGDKHAQRLITMDAYNAILRIIIHVPKNIRDLQYRLNTSQVPDAKESPGDFLSTNSRFIVCDSWIKRTLKEAHRYNLQWNVGTYTVLLQYYLMEDQLLKAAQLIDKLANYMYYLKKKNQRQKLSRITEAPTNDSEIEQKQDYFKAKHIYTKYKKIIEETQTRHREELLQSSSLIDAEKQNTSEMFDGTSQNNILTTPSL